MTKVLAQCGKQVSLVSSESGKNLKKTTRGKESHIHSLIFLRLLLGFPCTQWIAKVCFLGQGGVVHDVVPQDDLFVVRNNAFSKKDLMCFLEPAASVYRLSHGAAIN